MKTRGAQKSYTLVRGLGREQFAGYHLLAGGLTQPPAYFTVTLVSSSL